MTVAPLGKELVTCFEWTIKRLLQNLERLQAIPPAVDAHAQNGIVIVAS